jgi:hypothetical protein
VWLIGRQPQAVVAEHDDVGTWRILDRADDSHLARLDDAARETDRAATQQGNGSDGQGGRAQRMSGRRD